MRKLETLSYHIALRYDTVYLAAQRLTGGPAHSIAHGIENEYVTQDSVVISQYRMTDGLTDRRIKML